MSSESDDTEELLNRARRGEDEALNRLIRSLYERFRQMAYRRLRHERPGHSLGPSDLTDEALLRLLKGHELARAADEKQLFRAFARAMRQVLIDHARRRNADMRGGGRPCGWCLSTPPAAGPPTCGAAPASARNSTT
jgi:RNA polymerase sigma factor (TIGR02999 family)